MRQLLNTLYVLSEDAYLTLDGETVVVNHAQTELPAFRCTHWRASSASAMPGPAPP